MKKLVPYLFLFPACILLAVFVLYPMLQVLSFSVMRYSFFGSNEFVGFANYARLLSDADFCF